MNTLNRAVQTMAQAGIQVEQQSREEGEYLEVQIRVPKYRPIARQLPVKQQREPARFPADCHGNKLI